MSSIKKNFANPNILLLIISVFFGFLYSFYLFGYNIFPTNTDWLFYSFPTRADPHQHFFSWLFFLNDDNWHWPLTITTNLLYPTRTSVAFTDTIPIFAIFFKFFSPFLPEKFQYFGIFLLISFVLQFFWGGKLGLLFANNSLICAVFAGCFFMLSPPLTWRFSHVALTSHWLILATIWSYFSIDKIIKSNKIFIFQVFLIVIASGIHAYIATIVLSLSIIVYCKSYFTGKSNLKRCILYILITVISLIIGWYFFGYFSQQSLGGSYGRWSLNLLSIINPMNTSLLLKKLPIGQYQVGGYSYFGLGIILLLFSNLKYIVLKGKKYLSTVEGKILLLFSIALVIFAISNKIYLGEILVFKYELPSKVQNVFNRFQASNRFFWPVYYLILLSIIVSSFKYWTRKQVQILLSILIIIQFIDLIPLHQSVFDKAHNFQKSTPLISKEWQELSKFHDHLTILPSYQCGGSDLLNGKYEFFERLAASQKLTINSFRFSRADRSLKDFHCKKLPELVHSGRLEQDTAYVLDKETYSSLIKKINAHEIKSHNCSQVDGYTLCLRSALDVIEEQQPVSKLTQ